VLRRVPGAPRWLRAAAAPATLAVCLLAAAPAGAQGFGQWWWEAAVGLEQRNSDSERDGATVNSYRQTDLRVSTKLHGFVVHPAVGNFGVGLDYFTANRKGATDSDSLGFNGDLNLFPRGSVPIRLYAVRSLYDYSLSGSGTNVLPLRTPDTSTSWGAEVTARTGSIRGLSAGFDTSTSEFQGAAGDESQRGRLRWSRSFRNSQHDVLLDRFTRNFGSVDSEVDDLIANLNQRVTLSPTWRWTLRGTGTRREVTRGDRDGSATETAFLRSRLVHDMRERDELDLGTAFGVTSADASSSVENYDVSVLYRWRLAQAWEITPSTRYAMSTSDSITRRAPRVGVTTSWFRRAGSLETNLTANAGYGTVEQEDSTGTESQSDASYFVSGSLAHGPGTGMRKTLDVSAGHNQLRVDQVPILELPDLGISGGGLGTDDNRRARLSLSRQWDSQHAGGWIEWSENLANGSLFGASDRESLTASGQYGNHIYGVTGNLGQVRVTSSGGETQESRNAAANGFWRPKRYLTLRAGYRATFRNLDLSPGIDGERIEAALTIRIGLFDAEAIFFESREELIGGEVLKRTGFNWSIRRRLAGRLPVITGARRRGMIR